MKHNVLWLLKAEKRLNEINDYLISDFGEVVASKFNLKLYDLINTISYMPKIGVLVNQKLNIRSFVVIKQITVYYKVKSNELVILNLYDNRQNPKNRKY